jgi:hypothetical protein
MTAGPYSAPVPARPPARWGAGRIVALVLGLVLIVPGIGLLAGGGALLWADRAGRTDGYLMSSTTTLSAGGYALTSNRIDISQGASWVPVSSALGTARIQVTAAGGKDVFVGVAPAAAVTGYLNGVQRSVVDDLRGDGSPVTTVALPGGPPSGPPGTQPFWAARASGAGLQQLSWSPAQGDWAIVVMNADASPGVSVQARIGATVPALAGLAWGLLAGGLLLVVLGVLLVVLAARRRGGSDPYAAGTPLPATAPPPGWAPPQPRGIPTEEAPGPARAAPGSPGSPPAPGD